MPPRVITSDRGVEQYSTAIENAVNAVFADATKRSQFLGCTPTGPINDACVRGFIQTLGLRAWRRPLVGAELDRFIGVAASASTTWARDRGGSLGDRGALHLAELPLPPRDRGNGRGRGASPDRLRDGLPPLFLIWGSLPDKMLIDQATNGTLDTADGIRTAATRCWVRPPGASRWAASRKSTCGSIASGTPAKDPALFPEYATNLQTAMVRDIRDTWASLAFDDQASFYDLFTTTKVVVNADLARLYGIDATGLTVDPFQTRSLPAAVPPSGVLSRGRIAVGVRQPEIRLAHVAREVHPRGVDVPGDSAAAAKRQHGGRSTCRRTWR